MFGEALFSASVKARTGLSQWWSEFVAAFGLLMVIWGCARQKIPSTPFAVAAYITAAYWFTASTSFANPAAAFGRMWSDTFAGIAPSSVPGFIAAQCVGAVLGVALDRLLGQGHPTPAPSSARLSDSPPP
jgi:glycerol uptake facilitator-like aquaporin